MDRKSVGIVLLVWLGAMVFITLRMTAPPGSLFASAPEPEMLSLRDLGFKFEDPFELARAAGVAAMTGPTAKFFAVLLLLVGLYALYILLRPDDTSDLVVITKGRERQSVERRLDLLRRLMARDPAFEEGRFALRAATAYARVQEAWSEHELPRARAFLSDGLHERLRRQIDAQKAAGVRLRVGGRAPLRTSVLGYALGRHYDSASVRVEVSATRDSVETATGRVKEVVNEDFVEILTFLRLPGTKTSAKAGALEGKCPSCGAPLIIADAAQCGHCKSWINSGEFDWVLCDVTSPWEWRFPDPLRELTGWGELLESDPALSVEALEDRAACAFWRWQDARRRADPSPLRAIATDACAAAQLADGRFEREAHLGAMETVAFDPGEDFDRVHVQARWEAETLARTPTGLERVRRGRRTDHFVFKRKVGVVSDPKAGLSTSRCPSCGFPPATPDIAACAACARPFNDGSRGWVLDAIVPFGEWKRPEDRAALSTMGPLPELDWGESTAPAEALSALARCIRFDGRVTDRERAYFAAYAERRGVPEKTAEEIFELAAQPTEHVVPPEENPELLRGMVRACLLDGILEEPERRILLAAARGRGLHTFELNGIIREERHVLVERAKKILAGRTEDSDTRGHPRVALDARERPRIKFPSAPFDWDVAIYAALAVGAMITYYWILDHL